MIEAKLMRYWAPESARVAVVVEGRKLLHAIWMTDEGIVYRALPREEARFMKELPGGGRAAAARMLDVGRRLGIARAAKRFLERAA